MLLALRALPFFSALIMALGSMALFWFPTRPFLIIGLSLALLTLLLFKLSGRSFKKADFWSFFLLPFALALAAFSLLLFVEGPSMKILIITLATFLIWLFSENTFAFLYLSGAYQVNALEYLSLVVGVVSIFFMSSALFAFRLFFAAPLWLLLPFDALFVLAIFFSVLWICKIERERLWSNTLGAVLLLGELFWCLAWLPSSFFSNAALITLIFYLLLGIIRVHLLKRLSPKVLRHYIFAVSLIAFLVILTARWT